jgi:hypothetical protein
MTFMTQEQLEQVRQAHALQALWRELFPDIAEEAPYQSRLQKWLQLGGPDLCEYALRRTARKRWKAGREGKPLNAGQARAYCEHVIKNELEGRCGRFGLKELGDGWSVNAQEEQEAKQA